METIGTFVGIGVGIMKARESNQKRTQGGTLFSECIVGGAANAYTSALLNPCDVVKTRIQVHKTNVSMYRMFHDLYARGGLLGLWTPGLTATMVREMVNCSARTGLYAPVRDFLNSNSAAEEGHGSPTLANRITAAVITGTLGSVLSNPLDVVKVRLLNSAEAYPSTYAAYPQLLREEGWAGCFKGLAPSTLRGASIAVGELAAYDESKHLLKKYGHREESVGLHIAASLITGIAATTMASPFDVIKTRVMAGGSNAPGSALKVLSETLQTEGPRALFRGWVPSYFRLGPHALVCLPVFEQLREFVGVGYL